MNGTKIIPRQTVLMLIECYIRNVDRIKDAYKILQEAENDLDEVFGHQAYMCVLPQNRSPDELDRVLDELKRSAWKRIFKLGDFEKILSKKRRDEWHDRLEREELPVINVDEVFSMLEALIENADEFAKESAREAWDILRPAKHNSGRRLKTNVKNGRYDLGEKVILTSMVTALWSNWSFSGWNGTPEAQLRIIDRVFHALDGNLGLLRDAYQSPLVDAIQTTPTDQSEVETNYFRAKLYRNSNIHLTFKRMDLVERLNAICGDETQLKG